MSDLAARLRPMLVQIWRFGIVSILGLALDTATFLALVAMEVPVFQANAVSATLAVTFVFFASVRRIFQDGSRFLVGKFMAYLVFQIIAVAAASLAIDWMVGRVGLAPLLAKLLVLPVTFGSNFAFMRRLTRGRIVECTSVRACPGGRSLL